MYLHYDCDQWMEESHNYYYDSRAIFVLIAATATAVSLRINLISSTTYMYFAIVVCIVSFYGNYDHLPYLNVNGTHQRTKRRQRLVVWIDEYVQEDPHAAPHEHDERAHDHHREQAVQHVQAGFPGAL